LIGVLAGIFVFGALGCQQTGSQKGAEISPEEIQRLMAPRPFPPEREYVVATQPCVFFVRRPNGVLVAAHRLHRGQVVILLGIEGAWNDVQTLQGSVGRVMSGSLRFLTPEEASQMQ
jgi:hypothetical protein